jgi:surface antigen
MAAVLGLLFLVITLVVNVQGAHAQPLCSSGDRNLKYINQLACISGRGYLNTGDGYSSGGNEVLPITPAPSHFARVRQVIILPVPPSFKSDIPVSMTPTPTPSSSGNISQGNSGNPPRGTSNPFPYPSCTWWADQRFFELHGFYVPWRTQAMAWEWTARAYQFGWTVSSTPTIGSIINLQPWVQGAYGSGHVGVVEKILSNGHVIASNMSWGADPYQVVDVEFAPGPGVTFISY